MCRFSKINALPEIIKYGSIQVMLESSIKPQIKVSLSSAIKVLKQVAYSNKIVSLSANQIGLDERVFVAIKPELIKAGKWTGYDQVFQTHSVRSAIDAYEAIINPIEKSSSYDTYFGFQECPSFPGLKFKVPLPIFSNIKYITELALMNFLNTKKGVNQQPIPENLYCEKKITGFMGRVWDHQIRHLEGILPITQKVCRGQFYLLDDFKHDIQNVNYYENLKKIEDLYQEKNLKKMQREVSLGIKNKKNEISGFSSIPDIIQKSNLNHKPLPKKNEMKYKKNQPKSKSS